MNRDASIAIAGFAGFQLLNAWNNNAPALGELRASAPDDSSIRVKLRDADVLVGGTALIIGGTVYVLSGDKTALMVMAAIFVSVAAWHHYVLACSPVGKDRINLMTEGNT